MDVQQLTPEQRAAVRDLLTRYGQHTPDCALDRPLYKVRPACTCGLDALRAELGIGDHCE